MLREFINKELWIVLENVQQAEKLYFNNGKLSEQAKKYILHITGGDALTKLIADIYYAKVLHSHKMGHFLLSGIDGKKEKKYNPNSRKDGQDDVLHIDDLRDLKNTYLQLKNYNKNVFPISDFNINGVSDVFAFTRSLKSREKIIENMKKLPSVAIRNLKEEIRKPMNESELYEYNDKLEYFLAHYYFLSNRDGKIKKKIEDKMFKSNITLSDLLGFVEEKQNLIGGVNYSRKMIQKIVSENEYDLEIVYNSGNVMVIDVTDPAGIKAIGCNSLWCFTYGQAANWDQWSRYSTNGHVYAIIDFSKATDSQDFMYVLIKPLDFNSESTDHDWDQKNNSKLYSMLNQEEDNPLAIIDELIGLDKAKYVLNFGLPYDGPSSKWPYEDPNQLKLDLKEVLNNVLARLKNLSN